MKLITKNQLATHVMASKDPLRQALNQIQFKNNTASATNGHTLLQVKVLSPLPEKEFPHDEYGVSPDEIMIPAELAEKAGKNFPKPTTGMPILDTTQALHVKGNKVYISTPGVDVSEKMMAGKFPDIERVIPNVFDLDGGVEFACSAAYMKQVCDFVIRAQGNKDQDHRIVLKFHKSQAHQRPVQITAKTDTEEIKALIMPLAL